MGQYEYYKAWLWESVITRATMCVCSGRVDPTIYLLFLGPYGSNLVTAFGTVIDRVLLGQPLEPFTASSFRKS